MAAKRVLIVDDEENIGRSLRLILEREGYSVVLCRSAAEFRAHPDSRRADAYLFDVRLPDGNGIELACFARQRCPALRIIVVSGAGEAVLPPDIRLLAKPYRIAELLRAAHE